MEYKIDLDLTTPHMTGEKVKKAQHLLKENRWGISFDPGKSDGDYGPHTATAVHRAKYLLGYPKRKCNDRFGPKLYAYLVPKDDPHFKKLPLAYRPVGRLRRAAEKRKNQKTTREKATALALKQVGVTEYPPGSNNVLYNTWYYGHQVFGASTYPWCAVFVSWCFSQVGRSLHYASVALIFSDAQARRNNLELVGTPEPGDLVCLESLGHIGIFLKFVAGDQFNYVSGNTGSANVANGGAVEVHTLPRSIVNGWVRVKK